MQTIQVKPVYIDTSRFKFDLAYEHEFTTFVENLTQATFLAAGRCLPEAERHATGRLPQQLPATAYRSINLILKPKDSEKFRRLEKMNVRIDFHPRDIKWDVTLEVFTESGVATSEYLGVTETLPWSFPFVRSERTALRHTWEKKGDWPICGSIATSPPIHQG
jgi:hypothetical protein